MSLVSQALDVGVLYGLEAREEIRLWRIRSLELFSSSCTLCMELFAPVAVSEKGCDASRISLLLLPSPRLRSNLRLPRQPAMTVGEQLDQALTRITNTVPLRTILLYIVVPHILWTAYRKFLHVPRNERAVRFAWQVPAAAQ